MGMISRLATAPVPLPAKRILNKTWENVGDFWNDPRRWDGITDPRKQMFWMVRRPDVIDVYNQNEARWVSVPRDAAAPRLNDPMMQFRDDQEAIVEYQAKLMNVYPEDETVLRVGPGQIISYPTWI